MATQWMNQNRIVMFILLAYGISWLIALPLILVTYGIITLDIPFTLHYLVPLGPLISAFILQWSSDGQEGISDLLKRIIKRKINLFWIAVVVFSVWVLYAISGVVSLSMGQPWPDLGLFGNIMYMPYLTFIGAWLFWIATYGIGEETGWRGYLLHDLQSRHSPMVSSFIVGIIWAGWHVPMFFYNANFMSMGSNGMIFWIIGLMCGSIILMWIYNNTEHSILAVAIWHGTFNLFTGASVSESGIVAGVISSLVIVWAILLLIIGKRKQVFVQEW